MINQQNYTKIPSPWSQLAIFLGLLGAGYILGLLAGSAIILAKTGIGNPRAGLDLSDPALAGSLRLSQAVASILIFGLPAIGYSRITFRDHRTFYHLGLRPPVNYSFFILGALLLLTSFPLEGWLGGINKQIPLPDWMMKMEKEAGKEIGVFLKAGSVGEVIINLIVVAVIPAIFEELCFRGALQRILIQVFRSPWKGIVITALFFSAFHMQFQGFLPRMFLGILLGAVYWYSGSLWTSIIAHFFTNGIQVVAVIFYPRMMNEDPSVPLFLALISLLIVVGLLWVMQRQSETTNNEIWP